MAIVTTTYRYKRPPRKRKAVAVEGPAVVTAKSSRRPVGGTEEAAAEVPMTARTTGQQAQPSTPREAARVIAQPPANDDPKPAIVTATSQKRLKLLRADKRGRQPMATPRCGRGSCVPCRAPGRAMTDASHGLPTPRTTLRARYVSLLVWCKGGCQHQAHADLQKLIDAGRGDVPLIHLKFRCSNWGSPHDLLKTAR